MVLYAVAMAYVESAAVLYLRTIYGGVDPVGPRHTLVRSAARLRVDRDRPRGGDDGHARRRSATWRRASVGGRIGAFAVAMGVWDIFYYVFLWLFAGWPAVAAGAGRPVSDPAAVVGPGGLAGAARGGDRARGGRGGDGARAGRRLAATLRRRDWWRSSAAAGLCLVAFMANALHALPDGLVAAFSVRGGPFPWPIFLLGLVVGSFGLLRALTREA